MRARDGADDIGTSGVLLVELEVLRFAVVEVLAGVRGLVFEKLDEAVEADGEEGAERGAQPVDPVVAREGSEDDGGAEGAGGVEGACGVKLVVRMRERGGSGRTDLR